MNEYSPLETTTLYLAIGPRQLAALASSDYRCIEPGEGGELLVLFKLHQRYAEMVARQRLLPRYRAAWVVALDLPRAYLQHFGLSTVAYEEHLEYLVPVDKLADLSQHLAGAIAVVTAFRPGEATSIIPSRGQVYPQD